MKLKLSNESVTRTLGSVKVIDGVKTFVTHRKPEHFFIKFNGFGLNKGLIEELLRQGVYLIKVIYKGKSVREYLVNTKTVKKHGQYYHHEKFEPQYIISLDYMVEVESLKSGGSL